MNKKEWLMPEVQILGLEGTEECRTDDHGILIHTCKCCGRIFLTHEAEVNHEKNCPHNPAHKPVNPMPGEGEGLVPMS